MLLATDGLHHRGVHAGLDQAAADKLVAEAHQVCPYSNATRGNIDVAIDTTVT